MVPADIKHQTAVSTLVANYYRIEVSPNFGALTKDAPRVYGPLFLLKKNLNNKKTKEEPFPKKMNSDPKSYTYNKIMFFKAPEYWFKKNRNL